MIKCAPEKDPSTYIRTIQLVLFVWGYLVNGNNPKENKSHLSEDVPSSTVHHNNEMAKVQVANSRQMRHDPQLRGAPMGKRDE